MIKAVLFDLDGTLYDRDELIQKVVSGQYDVFREDLSSVPKDTFVNRVIQLDDHGYGDKTSLYAAVVGEWGLAPGLSDRLVESFWSSYDDNCRLSEDVRMTLNSLGQKGIKVGVITNGSTERQQRKLTALGLLSSLDVVLISETEGVRKPDREIFDRALTRCRVQASEALFVGDHPDADIRGALQAGMHAAWKIVPYWTCSHDVPLIRELSEILAMCDGGNSLDKVPA